MGDGSGGGPGRERGTREGKEGPERAKTTRGLVRSYYF